MNSQTRWKFGFIGIVVLVCIYMLIGQPSFPTSWASAKGNFSSQIKLGLDLKGGSHLVLQVQREEAIAMQCDQTVDQLNRTLHEKGIGFGEIRRVDDTHILVRDIAPSTAGAFRDLVSAQFTNWDMSPAAGENSGYLLTMKPAIVAQTNQQTMDQSLETIERRINALGLTEPTVAFTGRADDEILVQLPGEGDPTEAKEVIQAGGQLELKGVEGGPYPSEVQALSEHGGILPPGTELVPGNAEGPDGQTAGEVWYLLDRAAVVTGRDFPQGTIKIEPSADMPGKYEVGFGLYQDAAQRFGTFTESHISRPMAIVLDRRVISAPTIQARIEDKGRITGNFSQESAQNLALELKSGALPASIKYLEERTVGPSLGADSIREGVRASIGSLIVVMLFLVVYYRLSGWNAVLALLLNLLILLAAMAMFGAVLTLPGIAGVILTIGMGVDSNVLVFERIREELKNGKANASAVAQGFERAFRTIVDTHVTTVVSAVFLFLFGTGPVRGFAITLVIGLIANLFTSIYVSRAIFDLHLERMERQAELSI